MDLFPVLHFPAKRRCSKKGPPRAGLFLCPINLSIEGGRGQVMTGVGSCPDIRHEAMCRSIPILPKAAKLIPSLITLFGNLRRSATGRSLTSWTPNQTLWQVSGARMHLFGARALELLAGLR